MRGDGADEVLVWYEGSGTSDRRFLSADERGSIVSVTDGSGALLAINSYDEYGIPGSANVGRFQYTGQAWLPELGMYHYKARIYSPTLGRFLQTDPIGIAGGINLYGYVGNDPVNFTDPLGHCGGPATGTNDDVVVIGCRMGTSMLGGAGGGSGSNRGIQNSAGDLIEGLEDKGQREKQCATVPTPGLGEDELDQRVNNTAKQASLRKRDFFSVPSADNRISLFGKSLPGSRNDTKARVKGSAEYGNFLFGAEAAASGLTLDEALGWGSSAQIVQDLLKGKLPTGKDNPGDADAIKRGYEYYTNGCPKK